MYFNNGFYSHSPVSTYNPWLRMKLANAIEPEIVMDEASAAAADAAKKVGPGFWSNFVNRARSFHEGLSPWGRVGVYGGIPLGLAALGGLGYGAYRYFSDPSVEKTSAHVNPAQYRENYDRIFNKGRAAAAEAAAAEDAYEAAKELHQSVKNFWAVNNPLERLRSFHKGLSPWGKAGLYAGVPLGLAALGGLGYGAYRYYSDPGVEKTSAPRVSTEAYRQGWERIFGQKPWYHRLNNPYIYAGVPLGLAALGGLGYGAYRYFSDPVDEVEKVSSYLPLYKNAAEQLSFSFMNPNAAAGLPWGKIGLYGGIPLGLAALGGLGYGAYRHFSRPDTEKTSAYRPFNKIANVAEEAAEAATEAATNPGLWSNLWGRAKSFHEGLSPWGRVGVYGGIPLGLAALGGLGYGAYRYFSRPDME